MRDGLRRVTSIVEVSGLEGDVITMHELFNFMYRGDSRSNAIKGGFQSSGIRPKIADRAALYGLDHQLLETVGVVAS